MLTIIFKQILMLSFAGSIVALSLLIIRAILWRKIPAKLQYALWGILILRLLMPIAPESPMSLWNLSIPNLPSWQSSVLSNPNISHKTERMHTSIKTSDKNTTVDTSFHANPSDKAYNPSIYFKIASILWLTGVLVILIYYLTIHIVMRVCLLKKKSCQDSMILKIVTDARTILKVKKDIHIIYDSFDYGRSPSVFGIFKPKIILPRNIIKKVTYDELRYILMHEMTHIKRYDTSVNLIIMIIEAINWFNPIIWIAFFKMKEDCEISCDASVLSTLKSDEQQAYGLAIINVLRTMPSNLIPGTAGFTNNFSKRRIIMISNHKKLKNKKLPILWAIAALTIALLAGCASLPSSNATKSANKNSSDGWVYYINNKDNLKLYRSHADGSNAMKITNEQSSCPNVVGDYIYYVNFSDKQKIYKIHGDGTGKTKVSDDSPCANLTVSGKRLYFNNEFNDETSDCGKIFRMDLDGKNKTKICNDYTSSYMISGDWIYYDNYHDGEKLYKIRTSGDGKIKISDDEICGDFLVHDNTIYYVNHQNASASGFIYKMNLNGTAKHKIGAEKASKIFLLNETLYYYDANGTKLYKTGPNGTDKVEVKHNSWEEIKVLGYQPVQ